MILVDSSVWIQHFKRDSTSLRHGLENEEILIHPLILGELSLGNYKNRIEILDLLFFLPQVVVASSEEVFTLVENKKLYGKGLGWIDVNLIASSLLTHCQIWSYDKTLIVEAKRLKLATLSL